MSIPHGTGARDQFSRVAVDQPMKTKLVALNVTLTIWSPDGEVEAGEERPPDRNRCTFWRDHSRCRKRGTILEAADAQAKEALGSEAMEGQCG